MNEIKTQKTDEKIEQKPIAAKGFSAFAFYLWQFTWGLPVNIIGLIGYLITKPFCKQEKFFNSYITYVKAKNFGGVSLGMFIFMNAEKEGKWRENTKIHEYGHTIQCLFLGVFYWFVIAIPSFIWCNFFGNYRKKHKLSYYDIYCESWANTLGQKWSGLKQDYDN